jgi:diaminohydroxyphosphoribosylaminopyrimidine deaminase/5-amino-6-(5-phosphoribosylamino)uracil reductase
MIKDIPYLTEEYILHLKESFRRKANDKFGKTGLSFVTLKFAQTLDGKIATLNGDSRWISGDSSLRLAHCLRSCHDALLVGADTIIHDDPQLTVRLWKGKNPLKIIVDGRLRIPLNSKILKDGSALSTIIATTSLAEQEKTEKMRSKGVRIWVLKKTRSSRVDMLHLIQRLSRENIHSILVEGGSKIHASFLQSKLADHLVVVIAPMLVGKGINCVRPNIPREFKSLISLSSCRFLSADNDVILEAPIGT